MQFLNFYNGKLFFLNEIWQDSDSLYLYTDSAGSIGFGAIFGKHWCYGEWPREWQNRNIAILEFYPIVLSLLLWGSKMQNQCIVFHTDNEALVHVINKCTSKDKTLMVFVRKLVLVCLENNILFKAQHIPGVKNCLADALSRLQIQRFHQLAPFGFDKYPTIIPPELLPVSWHL